MTSRAGGEKREMITQKVKIRKLIQSVDKD